MKVEIRVEISAVNGRIVTFALKARDGAEEISTGEHTRAVVDVEKLRTRVAAKAAKAGGL
jgi:predicted thioesterase